MRRNFFQLKTSRIHRGWKARKLFEENKVRQNCFFKFSSSFQSFWEKLVKPESQTYLVYSMINYSAVSLISVIWRDQTEYYYKFITVQFIQVIKLACKAVCVIISTSQQSHESQQAQTLFAGANIGIINIQLLVLPCSRESRGRQIP